MKDDVRFDSLFRKTAFQDNQLAFQELFFEFYPALCVVAGRYVICEETVEDIVQETFFKIWKNRKKIDLNTSFRNFLITSLHNNCIDYIRKQNVVQRYKEKQTSLINNIAFSPEEVYTLKELELMINKALDKLSPKIREAFEMSRFKGMKYAEIANEMAVSQKTIEAHISKALSVLRAELKDYLPFLFL